MNLFPLISLIAMPLVAFAFLLAFVRLVRGPTLPDRVVALDLMAVLGIGFIAHYAVITDQSMFLDVAVVIALIGFLAVVAFAYYMRRGI